MEKHVSFRCTLREFDQNYIKDILKQKILREYSRKEIAKAVAVPWPPRIVLAPLLAPHFSRRVRNFELRIYCLLKILANEKSVQGMNIILIQNVALAFFVSFGFACKQQLIGNF